MMGTAYICYAYMQPKKLHSAYDIISASTETEIFPLEQHTKREMQQNSSQTTNVFQFSNLFLLRSIDLAQYSTKLSRVASKHDRLVSRGSILIE